MESSYRKLMFMALVAMLLMGKAAEAQTRYFNAEGKAVPTAEGAFVKQVYAANPNVVNSGAISVTYYTSRGNVVLAGTIENGLWHGPYSLLFSGGQVAGEFVEGYLQPAIKGPGKRWLRGHNRSNDPFARKATWGTPFPIAISTGGEFLELELEFSVGGRAEKGWQ